MMKQLVLIASLFLSQFSFCQKIYGELGKPIFWYRVSDPWGMFMGAEGPLFVLYDQGKILYWKNGDYHLSVVEQVEQTQLINDLQLTDTFFQKSRWFNATNPDPNGEGMATDNPSYTAFVNFDSPLRSSTLIHPSTFLSTALFLRKNTENNSL